MIYSRTRDLIELKAEPERSSGSAKKTIYGFIIFTIATL